MRTHYILLKIASKLDHKYNSMKVTNSESLLSIQIEPIDIQL